MSAETDPLLERTQPSRSHRLSRYLRDEIDTGRAHWILLVCYVITGLLDSSAVLIWGSFVSMQTGNSVYFGLGLVGTNDKKWIKSGISIIGFCLGSLAFSTFHRILPPRGRWVLMSSFFIQLLCIVIAATVVTVYCPSREDPLDWPVLLPLILVSFQSSGQAVASRVLKCNGLTSVVLTSVYCDLFSHPDLLVVGEADEIKRVAAILCLIFGTVLGGMWAQSTVGLVGALWMASLLKGLIIISWFQWNRKEA